MSSLPDRKRPRLSQPARALAASLAHLAVAAAWRVKNPAAREGFVEAPRPPLLTRLYYEAADGWRAPLFHLPPAPGGAGEPVVLAHALGLGADAWRYGAGPTLAGALAEAGFSVYLLAHRGDRAALRPPRRTGLDFDAVVAHDVPAALERACAHAGFPRAHWVGHGFGGQLGLAWAGRSGAERLATLTAVCAAVRFERPSSEVRRAAAAAAWLPPGLSLPADVASLAAPFVDAARVAQASPPARVRGALRYASDDVAAGLVAQIGRWLDAGSLVDASGWFDYAEALRGAHVPLLVGSAAGDAVCPAAHARAALETWGHDDTAVLELPEAWGHLDPLLAASAPERLHAPVVRWLDARRRLAWERDGEIGQVRSA